VLWDIRAGLGHTKADTIILQAQFDNADPTTPQLARKAVPTAQRVYGNSAATAVQTAFLVRGFVV
jgi:hypothetical protein